MREKTPEIYKKYGIGPDMKIPAHVSIIMDGNGRWAKLRGKPRGFGHEQGAKVLMDIVEDAMDLGIKCMTVYAFSTENWNRSKAEVGLLMSLFGTYLKICQTKAMENNVRVRVIGDRTALSAKLVDSIEELEKTTAGNTDFDLVIAINYGSRDEIIRAVRRIADDVSSGKIKSSEIDADMFSGYLDTAGLPDPDLCIRTSGEERLSNYLMWQHAYSEFYFTSCLWPDFNMDELVKAVKAYNGRDRRFGGAK